MRLTIFLFFCATMFSMSNLQAQNISLHLKEAKITQLFSEITKQTNQDFVYTNEVVKQAAPVSIQVNNVSVSEALKIAFKNQPLTYRFVKNTIVVSYAPEKPGIARIDAAPPKKIKGKVTDAETGMPIPDATVNIQGAVNMGVITDKHGGFVIEAEEGEELVISHISFQTQFIKLSSSDVLIIALQPNASELSKIQITGYQRIDKRFSTSAISTVMANDVLVPGMTSIDQALEGRVPDLVVLNNSGEVGATPRLRVRGTSTLLGNREPLWVLDGFIMRDPVNVSNDDLNNPDYINIVGNAIAGINPQDIERIDILKDASATALYGTRAANGVVVVTTKKGAIGPAKISYNHSSKITQRPRYTDRNINLMNSQERMQFGQDLSNLHYQFPSNMPLVGYEGALYRLYKGMINYEQFTEEVKWYESVNTDWFSILTRDAYSTDNTLSVSGGQGALRYYGSIGFNPEQGVSIGTNTNRVTSRINLDFGIKERLKVNFSVFGNTQKRNNLNPEIQAIDYAYNTTRTLPYKNEDGSLFYYDKIAYNGLNRGNKAFRYNIFNEIDNSSNTLNGNSIGTNLNLRYKVVKNLEVSLSGSYNSSSTLQERWWGERSHYVARLKNGEVESIPRPGTTGYSELPYGGILLTANSKMENYTLRAQADYNKRFGTENQHLFTAMGGFELNGSNAYSIADENRGFVKDRGLQFIDQIDFDNFPYYKTWINKNHRQIRFDKNRQVSTYTTWGYSYLNYFTINANARIDASNKFGSRSNEKMLPVWSVSGMFNVKEVLIPKFNLIDDWRIRSSFGKQGNMLDDQSPNLIIKQGTLDPIYNENISYIARYPNPNLLWEQTNQFNLAMDISFLQNRLNLSGTYYAKKTKDAFTTVKISSVNGVMGNSYVMNGGDLENSGYSITVGGVPIKTKYFSWRSSTYFGGNFNKVKTNKVEAYGYNDYLNGTALVGGQPVSTFYSYKFLGLNPTNGSPVFDDYNDRRHLLEGKSLEEVMMLTTVNSGQREPIFTGALSNTFTYKQLSLLMNFTYSLGAKMRLFAMYDPIISGVSAENNIRKEFLNRWMLPGDETYTNIPAIMSPAHPEYFNYNPHYSSVPAAASSIPNFASNLWAMYDRSDARVVSANYFKLSTLSLRYSLPAKTLKHTAFSNATVSFNTINLFTISAKELKGQDPTQAGFAKPNLSIRPTYTLQFNVSF